MARTAFPVFGVYHDDDGVVNVSRHLFPDERAIVRSTLSPLDVARYAIEEAGFQHLSQSFKEIEEQEWPLFDSEAGLLCSREEWSAVKKAQWLAHILRHPMAVLTNSGWLCDECNYPGYTQEILDEDLLTHIIDPPHMRGRRCLGPLA
ncbi:MAG: hypothetical protein E6R03_12645 [Hyphomicrobiaceae bacterium]|nr:MAG: hypothetical protein E6R03_12645 [Hyphomicrobiaceae bacterium]